MIKRLIITTLMLLSGYMVAFGQSRISFWNLENLFDTVNNPATYDNDFTPQGRNKWDSQKYFSKTEAIRDVIKKLGPDIMGICEIENDNVLKDILPEGYNYIHYDSPDSRGLDVALIYRSGSVAIQRSEPIKAYGKRSTRDILLVEATVNGLSSTDTINSSGASIVFLVVHLPSRRGNDRIATLQRQMITNQLDSISRMHQRVVLMGDLNQNPSADLLPHLYNITDERYRKGGGSYAYRDVWLMYDQILLSRSLVGFSSEAYIYSDGLIESKGRFKGYPSKGKVSDHLPVYFDIRF